MHYKICRVVGITLLGAIALTATVGIVVLSVNKIETPTALVATVSACITAIAALVPTVNQVQNVTKPRNKFRAKPPVQMPAK